MTFEKIIEYGYDALEYVSDRAIIADVAIGELASYASLSNFFSGHGTTSLLCGVLGVLAITAAYASYKFEKEWTRGDLNS